MAAIPFKPLANRPLVLSPGYLFISNKINYFRIYLIVIVLVDIKYLYFKMNGPKKMFGNTEIG
jgi:hypothetical protein